MAFLIFSRIGSTCGGLFSALLLRWGMRGLLLRLLASMLIAPAAVPAQDSRAPEPALKAAFIYNFLQFVTWPENAFSGLEDPLVIGVVGETPVLQALRRDVEGKTVSGRKIVVRQVRNLPPEGVHVLFVAGNERRRLPQILESVEGHPVLTVGETDQFAQEGGIINFFQVQNKIHFEINPLAAERSGLKISSRLLKLARIVSSETLR